MFLIVSGLFPQSLNLTDWNLRICKCWRKEGDASVSMIPILEFKENSWTQGPAADEANNRFPVMQRSEDPNRGEVGP